MQDEFWSHPAIVFFWDFPWILPLVFFRDERVLFSVIPGEGKCWIQIFLFRCFGNPLFFHRIYDANAFLYAPGFLIRINGSFCCVFGWVMENFWHGSIISSDGCKKFWRQGFFWKKMARKRSSTPIVVIVRKTWCSGSLLVSFCARCFAMETSEERTRSQLVVLALTKYSFNLKSGFWEALILRYVTESGKAPKVWPPLF